MTRSHKLLLLALAAALISLSGDHDHDLRALQDGTPTESPSGGFPKLNNQFTLFGTNHILGANLSLGTKPRTNKHNQLTNGLTMKADQLTTSLAWNPTLASLHAG
ncbi:hypothetical protein T492DRAFT_1110236 [Pavlovales sp. CCMP2436]|nr:hypothetical protein T492DRAFT_1110236 [Pavlovales sp. CCMP2436]